MSGSSSTFWLRGQQDSSDSMWPSGCWTGATSHRTGQHERLLRCPVKRSPTGATDTPHERFRFIKLDLANRNGMRDLFADQPIGRVVHLAAQAGVRYSLINPHAYTESNIEGFLNILEGCRHITSSTWCMRRPVPCMGATRRCRFLSMTMWTIRCSLYAASKKANELMAHCYAHLYRLPCTGLRFFTVYGPWGRPDMALFIFTKAILEGKPIEVFNQGKMKRDFTFVDDIVEGVIRTLDHTATPNPSWSGDKPDPGTSQAPARVYNIGNHQPVELLHFIDVLEQAIGEKAERKSCRCSREMSRRPMRTSTISCTMWGLNRLPLLRKAFPASFSGIAIFIESEVNPRTAHPTAPRLLATDIPPGQSRFQTFWTARCNGHCHRMRSWVPADCGRIDRRRRRDQTHKKSRRASFAPGESTRCRGHRPLPGRLRLAQWRHATRGPNRELSGDRSWECDPDRKALDSAALLPLREEWSACSPDWAPPTAVSATSGGSQIVPYWYTPTCRLPADIPRWWSAQ